MKLLSVVINADTRAGFLQSARGEEWGNKSLHGVRSVDFLIDGVRQKMNFFRGYDTQCILYVDQHLPLSFELINEIESMVSSYGNNSKFILLEHDRNKPRWNDYIYLEALKLAEGNFVVHFDQDCNAYRTDDCDIIRRYLLWLNNQYKFVCQPWDGIGDVMHHASTRFFICKKETLNFPLIEKSIHINPLMGKNNPCLESTLGLLSGEGNVLYPDREDDKYVIFSWATYNNGTLRRLNRRTYEEVKKYVTADCGLHGPNDCVDNPEKL